MIKILAFSGSDKPGSYNQQMVNVAARGANMQGAQVSVVNLGQFELPLFSETIQAQGIPQGVKDFKALLASHDGLLIASPEYNGAYSPLLKNALDWASRSTADKEPSLSVYRNKSAAIMSASPGGLGGMRGLIVLRMLLANLGVTVLAQQQTLGSAHSAFDESGEIIEQPKRESVEAIGAQLARHLAALHP